jgi:hypothetical protein
MTDDIGLYLADWGRAERTGDAVRLDELLADDFVGIGPLGFSLSKAEWLARHRQGLSYQAFDVEDAEVRDHSGVVGDGALRPARHRLRQSHPRGGQIHDGPCPPGRRMAPEQRPSELRRRNAGRTPDTWRSR